MTAPSHLLRRINFESPNHNIGLPVFTIHGNHDDPTGTTSLSAVNVLSTAMLVNYFGKAVRRSAHNTVLARLTVLHVGAGRAVQDHHPPGAPA